MISVETFKKVLGKKSVGLSDTDIEKVMALQYKLANTLFDLWVKKSKITSIDTIVVTHKKDGNCVVIFDIGIMYAH